jgi:hypothetical protein
MFIRAVTRPYAATSGMSAEADDEVRNIHIFDRWVVSHHTVWGKASADSRILREEGNGDVFELRRWRGGRASADSDSDYSSVDSDVDVDVLI